MLFAETSKKEKMDKVTKEHIISKTTHQRINHKKVKKSFATFEITNTPFLFYDTKSKNLEQIIERNQNGKTQAQFNNISLYPNANQSIKDKLPEIQINIIKNKVVTILSSNEKESVNALLDKIATIIKKKRRLSQWRHYSINSRKTFQEDINTFNTIDSKKSKMLNDSKQMLSRSQEQMINKGKSLGFLGLKETNQKDLLKKSIPTKYIRYKKIKKNKEEKYRIENIQLDIAKNNKFSEDKTVTFKNDNISLFGKEKQKTETYSLEVCQNNIIDIAAKNEIINKNDLRLEKIELSYKPTNNDEYIISRKYKKLLCDSLPELSNFNDNTINPSNDSNFDTILKKYQPENEITTYGFEVIDTLASTTDEVEMINDNNDEESEEIQKSDSIFTNKLKRRSQEDIYTSTKDNIMKSILALKVKKNILQSIRNFIFPILCEKLKYNKFAYTIQNVDSISNEKMLKKGLMIWNIQRIKGKMEEEKKKRARIEKFEINFKIQKMKNYEIEQLVDINFDNSIKEKSQKYRITQNDLSINNFLRKYQLLLTQTQFQFDYEKTFRWSSIILPSSELNVCLLSKKPKSILYQENTINDYFLSSNKTLKVVIQKVMNHTFMSHSTNIITCKSLLFPEHLLSIYYPSLKLSLSPLIITSESFYMNPLLSNKVLIYEGERDDQNISSDGININIVKTKVVKISSVAEKESVSELLDTIINIMKKKRRFTQWKKSRKQIQIVVC